MSRSRIIYLRKSCLWLSGAAPAQARHSELPGARREDTQFKRLIATCSANVCVHCVQTQPQAPSGQTWDINVTMDWGVSSRGSQTRFTDQEMGNELFVATLPSLVWVNGNKSIHYPRLIVGMLITPHSEPTPILSFSLNFKWIMETLRRSDLDCGLTDTSPGNLWVGTKLIELTHQSHISQSGSDTVRPSLAHPDITLWTNCMDILFYHPLHYAIDGADLSKIITIPEPVSEMRCGGGSRNIFREDLGGLHLKI